MASWTGRTTEDLPRKASWIRTDDAELEDAVDAAKDARIVIMNPPFTNRAKMGEKFSNEKPFKSPLRETDRPTVRALLAQCRPEIKKFRGHKIRSHRIS